MRFNRNVVHRSFPWVFMAGVVALLYPEYHYVLWIMLMFVIHLSLTVEDANWKREHTFFDYDHGTFVRNERDLLDVYAHGAFARTVDFPLGHAKTTKVVCYSDGFFDTTSAIQSIRRCLIRDGRG